MIFITVVSSWTGALLYDRRQKKKVQQKWCTLVEHIAQESLQPNSMQRKITIILGAPPGDGLRSARDHFREYVKPVLVAGALDWDVIEGRREGGIRAGLAERIRRFRRSRGEPAGTELEADVNAKLADMRARTGIYEHTGTRGEVVIGRHTWKEYVRGLHEGWLGPLDPPKPKPQAASETTASPQDPLQAPETQPSSEAPTAADSTVPQQDPGPSPQISSIASDDDASPTATAPPSEEAKTETKKEEPKKPLVPPPHDHPQDYASSPLPASIPQELSPASAIPFPHILGFLNTPIRMYRFLNRRHLAEDVGRQTAAAVLAAYRPFRDEDEHLGEHQGHNESSDFAQANGAGDEEGKNVGKGWEQQSILQHEEHEWHKKSMQRMDNEREEGAERTWLDAIVIDPRIGQRMRRFEVEPGDEERARRIWKGAKGVPGRRAGDDGRLEEGSGEEI